MALQGTIKDFGLADIFQLIGIQRKTGVLTLENAEDTVTVHFLEGQVVSADTRLRNLEDLLGAVLVRTGRVTEEQLQEALAIQKKTLQRLGFILVKSGFISEEDLREALQVQVTQIVYRLFRWKEGDYRFNQTDHVDFDREHFVPVSAETILMEGARMVDEWPIIERKIRSAQMVFEKTEAAAELETPVESIVDLDIDLRLQGGEESAGADDDDSIRLSLEDRELLRMVDGHSTVQEIVDRSPLGEFDVYRILYELLTRHLIEEIRQSKSHGLAQPAESGGRWLQRIAIGVVCGAALLSLFTLGSNPVSPWRMALEGEASERLKAFASRERLARLEQAIQVFYLDLGTVPDTLDRLVQHGYLESRDLVDPWGKPYVYELGPGGYRVAGLDSSGSLRPDLIRFHRFSSVQRMILEGLGEDGKPDSSSTP